MLWPPLVVAVSAIATFVDATKPTEATTGYAATIMLSMLPPVAAKNLPVVAKTATSYASCW